MEKWKCRGKSTVKQANDSTTTYFSVRHRELNCSSSEKKKEKKWSFGGLLKRISKNEVTENSIIGENDAWEIHHHQKQQQQQQQQQQRQKQQTAPNIIKRDRNDYHQQDVYNNHDKNEYQHQLINSGDLNINLNNERNSLESSSNKNSRRNRIKARIKAKRDKYCGESSSDNEINVNKSTNSLMQIQSEDSINLNSNNNNNLKNEISKKTRGARTERYMKRIYREDVNGGNENDLIKQQTITTDCTQLCKNKKKIFLDTLSPSITYNQSKDQVFSKQTHVKSPTRYYQAYCSEQNLVNVLPGRNVDVSSSSINLYNIELPYSDKCTWPQSRRCKVTPINWNKSPELDDDDNDVNNYRVDKTQPPVPPPRSSKSRLFSTPNRFSLQNSDIENEMKRNNRYTQLFHLNNSNNNDNNCNSLDRIQMSRKYYTKIHPNNKVAAFNINDNNNSSKLTKFKRRDSPDNSKKMTVNAVSDCKIEEKPIVPKIKQTRLFFEANNVRDNNVRIAAGNEELEQRRHSKNLEEALLELETIYNSLRLSDEDLLDRAEQRSMEEYRDRVATTAIEGSIKSSSDTSSSYELGWRHANFDRCHENDTRLKDDMAYRRMHQNDRPPSVDPSQSSLSRVSYLATSPSLGYTDYLFINNYNEYNNNNNNNNNNSNIKPKSRRGTPDLIHDDVVFRSITHANNTLKVIDPQPPFGIPLGPVTAASESDYLHVEPTKESHLRSPYIPKSEPDVVTDDLAFRNLRKDTSKDKSVILLNNTNFISPTGLTSTSTSASASASAKKKRAVRSLSADLYGIIDKNSDNHAWYREYVKLNRPSGNFTSRSNNKSYDDNHMTTPWLNNRKYFDVDINGNRPKSMYQGRIQVCIPQEEEITEQDRALSFFELINKLQIPNNKCTTTTTTTTAAAAKEAEALSSSSSSSASSTCYNQKKTTNEKCIHAFSDQELSEYQQLCRDLESLIKKTSEKVKSMETKSDTDSRKNSLSEFIDWENLLENRNDDTRSTENKRACEPSKLTTEQEINIKERRNTKVTGAATTTTLNVCDSKTDSDKEIVLNSQTNFSTESDLLFNIVKKNYVDRVDQSNDSDNDNDNRDNNLPCTEVIINKSPDDDLNNKINNDITVTVTVTSSNVDKNLNMKDMCPLSSNKEEEKENERNDLKQESVTITGETINNNSECTVVEHDNTNNKKTPTSPLLSLSLLSSNNKDEGNIKNSTKICEGRETTQ